MSTLGRTIPPHGMLIGKPIPASPRILRTRGGRASAPYTHPSDGHSPPALDIVQDFEVAAVRLLECFAQDALQSAWKRESSARIAQLVDGTEPERASALVDAIESALGAERADICLISFIATCVTRIRPARLAKNACFVYISELTLTYVFPPPISVSVRGFPGRIRVTTIKRQTSITNTSRTLRTAYVEQ
jgi:hypothetical protein